MAMSQDGLGNSTAPNRRQSFNQTNNVDGLVQERRNSSALAVGFCFSCTNSSIYEVYNVKCPLCIKYFRHGPRLTMINILAGVTE